MLAILPKRAFCTERRLSKKQLAEIEEVLSSPLMTSAKEHPMTKQRKALLEQIIGYEQQWIEQELGLSVEKRIPATENIHFYKGKEAEKIGEEYRQPPGWAGLSSRTHAYIKEVKEFPTTPAVVHELTHMLGYALFDIRGQNTFAITQTRSGYRMPVQEWYRGFNEALTEMIALEVREFCAHHGLVIDKSLSYHPLVIYIDMLVKDAAQKTKQRCKDIRYSLYKGYFDGGVSSLALFGACGKKVAENILYLGDETGNLIIDKKHIDALKKKIYAYKACEEITLLDDIKIQKR